MPAYLLADTLLDDPDTYEQYKVQAKPLIESYGGRYLVRGGPISLCESELWKPTRLVLVEFADAETARRCYNSPEYQAILPISARSARRTVLIVEGV